ncbi:RpoE-regulated lipoprotein [Pseudocitrobacter faecalis]|uniref:RpoE-regulated lipoprotein n=1 Tax=Pseudocitrobacter faecalis TaxID=1398493 RepID=UPI0016772536|nr:RpoE-regulated lipoprotein [Pseudocitrobacter faecalis]GHD89586.1 RpoE-regulated lipoprotein [Pseudocitrobacter faecalis]
MKSLRLLVCALPLALTGCSTLSAVNWSAANPWNWFGSSIEVTEQGVGGITSTTALDEKAITDALDGDYRLRSGMKTDNGTIVRYFEALDGDKLALVVNGENGSVSRIDVLDSAIKTDSGVEIGSTFSDIYSKAYGHCQKATGDDSAGVECKAEGSQHISYLFTGEWSGPQDLMPSDDALKNWTLKKIVWRR